MGKTGSVYAICSAKAFLSQAEGTGSAMTAVFTAAWLCLVSTGSFRYVGDGYYQIVHVGLSYAACLDGQPHGRPQPL